MECLHRYSSDIKDVEPPVRFNNPFNYRPHRLCELAVEELRRFIAADRLLSGEVAEGKMFGVLVVRDENGALGYLTAFSGLLGGSNVQCGFVPPIFDFQSPEGYFKCEETAISQINKRIAEVKESDGYQTAKEAVATMQRAMDEQIATMRCEMNCSKERRTSLRASGSLTSADEAALVRESQHQKAELKRLTQRLQHKVDECKERLRLFDRQIEALKDERKQRSAALQEWLFSKFLLFNGRGEKRCLLDVFKSERGCMPPAGTGECAAPKLLQYAFKNGLTPLCMAEFWIGASPAGQLRKDGYFYGSCKEKCEPLLNYMLQGLDVEPSPLLYAGERFSDIPVIYEDEWLLVVDKPSGMLSVPGKVGGVSVQEWLASKYDRSDIFVVHRLDMATSGLLVAAKGASIYKAVQSLFARRKVKKRYVALLAGVLPSAMGQISLPLMPDYENRPLQMVSREHGKEAVTDYSVIKELSYLGKQCTLVNLYPLTGRTHQLRVHCAHAEGLDCAIVGDELYGVADERLMLHATYLEFIHPVTGNVLRVHSDAAFNGVDE